MTAISTAILAGGRGTRIGGAKGLQLLHGRALLDCVLMAVRQQSDEVLINVHTHDADYERDDCCLIVDQSKDEWMGPLAGLQSALSNARHNLVATVPCDTPFLPGDLMARLLAAINSSAAEAAVAVVGGRRQAAIVLYQRRVQPKLDAYLAAGGRKVNVWLDSLHLVEVPFDNPAAFVNLNSSRELLIANQILQAGGKYYDVEFTIA